jgi:hypothetical protein
MTLHPVPLGGPSLAGLRLKAHAIAVPALSSHVRPALVIAERETRLLDEAARAEDVNRGGRFAANPACVQLWSGPWAGDDDPGESLHLGSVDWNRDTPVPHYVTIYRVVLTASGLAHGETTLSLLRAVVGLAGVEVDDARVTMPTPPTRDPFRRTA